jgi:metallo-beta-lactamase family protein
MTSVTILGASGGIVTGSSYLVEGERGKVLVDFGAFQGKDGDGKNIFPKVLNPKELSSVIITHGHLDHVGRLPLLIQRGYKGAIYATQASIKMLSIILRDAARIQENDKYDEKPLYTSDDVERTIERCKKLPYHSDFDCGGGFTVRAIDSGHMLGSVSLSFSQSKSDKTIVFSGDIGPRNIPYLKDFETFSRADLAFLESTYGDREHKPLGETIEELRKIILAADLDGGKILIPAFSIGRTQQLIYHLAELSNENKIPRLPVYIDSPMAVHANEVYRQHQELFDDHARAFIQSGEFGNYLKSVHPCETVQQSKALNSYDGPCIIIAGSGMCNGGRILHHLKHHLGHSSTRVVIPGFQAEGTLGRKLVEQVPEVFIYGDRITVRATVHTLGGFSAHAGQKELLLWANSLKEGNARFALTHGEDSQRAILRDKLIAQGVKEVSLPLLGDVIPV